MPAQRERTSIPYHARLHAGVLKREMAEVHACPTRSMCSNLPNNTGITFSQFARFNLRVAGSKVRHGSLDMGAYL
jgi:hypothetical protein